MKLSHALMMNGMDKPQGFGPSSITSKDAPCAIGGALQAIGIDNNALGLDSYAECAEQWPWTRNESTCPACGLWQSKGLHTIFHLNDQHEWTRAQIAEWAASVEPQEEEEPTASLTAPLETALPVQGH